MDELIESQLKEYRTGLDSTKAQEQRYIGAIAALQDLQKKLDDGPDDRGTDCVPEDGLPDEPGA